MIIKVMTYAGYPVYINSSNIVRVWIEPEGERKGQTAVMYAGGVMDHVTCSIASLLKAIKGVK